MDNIVRNGLMIRVDITPKFHKQCEKVKDYLTNIFMDAGFDVNLCFFSSSWNIADNLVFSVTVNTLTNDLLDTVPNIDKFTPIKRSNTSHWKLFDNHRQMLSYMITEDNFEKLDDNLPEKERYYNASH